MSAREAVTKAELAIAQVVEDALNDLDEDDLKNIADWWGTDLDRVSEAWEDAEVTVMWSTPARKS